MGTGGISYAFGPLKSLADTFAAVAGGGRQRTSVEKRAVDLVTQLGGTAVPMLARKLRVEDEDQASWAYFLLARAGGERAVGAARELALDDSVSDAKKALALALLTELGAELPEAVTLRDPAALREESVRDLVGSLATPADVARAADLLLDQVAAPDLPAFVAEMADVAGAGVAPLVDELLVRDDLEPDSRDRLRTLRTALPPVNPPATPRRRVTVRLAEHPDGRRALLASTRAAGDAARLRALLAHVGADGALAAARHLGDLPARTGLARIEQRLVAEGYALLPATRAQGARLVGDAARQRHEVRGSVPREYYLGRDLLGLTDEHLRAPELRRAADDELLAAGVERLAAGDAVVAHDLLERFVAACPDEAEGRSCLGTALLELGRAPEALAQFTVAVRLEPDEPIRHWNLAHAAKRAGKLGGCYLALTTYLGRKDRSEGAADRVRAARRFVRMFERYARKEHGDAPVERVARAEELFERAYEHLGASRLPEAIGGFEAVIKLVPSHYPSWGNLGAAFVQLGRADEAARCFQRALDLNPEYEVARRNLAALHE